MEKKKRKKIELSAFISGGNIIIPPVDEDRINQFILDWEDKEIVITYDASDSRSKKQNGFFHAVIIPATMRILRELGHIKWTEQEYIKEVILKKPFLTVNVGQADEYIRHTSDLTTGEMWKFINQCLVLIADLGGRLTGEEQQKYLDIVDKYKIGEGIDEAVQRDL
jgi:hypothetical protein